MTTSLAVLLAGYSVVAAGVIAFTQFWRTPDDAQARWSGLVLLAALAGLQAIHFLTLQLAWDWSEGVAYRVLLFAVAPAFFLHARTLLAPRTARGIPGETTLHVLPVALAVVLPVDVAVPLAFLVGAGYLMWLGRTLYALRAEREQFALEVRLLGAVFVIALMVALLGMLRSSLPGGLFHELHAAAIGVAFILVQVSLGVRPQLAVEVVETARAVQAHTTLANVDCDAVVARLDALMRDERLYADAELDLRRVAERLDVSTHQLSELLNRHLGKGFARYLREHRVAAAKIMLIDEPKASVLSIGLAVGFTAQSNFYEAFREIEGTTPGQYRKLHAGEPS